MAAALAEGVDDGHDALCEAVPAFAARSGGLLAPHHEAPQLALGVVMPRPGLCRVGAGPGGEPRGISDPGGVRSRHSQRLSRNASKRSFGRKRAGADPEGSAYPRARSFGCRSVLT